MSKGDEALRNQLGPMADVIAKEIRGYVYEHRDAVSAARPELTEGAIEILADRIARRLAR